MEAIKFLDFLLVNEKISSNAKTHWIKFDIIFRSIIRRFIKLKRAIYIYVTLLVYKYKIMSFEIRIQIFLKNKKIK
jgi:hypothetical protein